MKIKNYHLANIKVIQPRDVNGDKHSRRQWGKEQCTCIVSKYFHTNTTEKNTL